MNDPGHLGKNFRAGMKRVCGQGRVFLNFDRRIQSSFLTITKVSDFQCFISP